MKKFINAFILLFFLMIAGNVHSQFTINVATMVSVNPPYTNKLTDFLDLPHRLNIMLTYYIPGGPTSNPAHVKLVAKLKGDNGVEISTGDNPTVTTPITLLPMLTSKTLGPADFKIHFNPNNLIYTGITKDEALNLKGLPEGTYQFCAYVVVYNAAVDYPIISSEVCSNSFKVSDVEAPVIILPTEGQEFTATTPQNIVFSWTVPAGAPLLTNYKLRIVDVIPADRNPNDAMNTAVYPYFLEQTVSSNAFVYGPAQPLLKEGHTYAFTVTAYDQLNKAYFKNSGTSEVSYFKVKSSTNSLINSLVSSGNLTNNYQYAIPEILQPITAVVSGKLSYKYKEDGKTAPMNSIKVRLVDKLIFKTADGNQYDVDPMWQKDLNGFTNPDIVHYLLRMRYYYSGNDGMYSNYSGNWLTTGGPSQMTLTTGTTDASGNFTLSGALPLIPGISINGLGKVFENIQMNSSYITGASMDAWGNYFWCDI